MNWDRLRDWLDNPILVKHVRSRLRKQPLAAAIVVVLVLLPVHRLGGIPARGISERSGVRHAAGASGHHPGRHGGDAGRLVRRRGAGVRASSTFTASRR